MKGRGCSLPCDDLFQDFAGVGEFANAVDGDADSIAVFEIGRRFHAFADAGRRTGEDHITGFQGEHTRAITNEERNVEDKIFGVAVLTHFAVDGPDAVVSRGR
jgi:hypothetical protein